MLRDSELLRYVDSFAEIPPELQNFLKHVVSAKRTVSSPATSKLQIAYRSARLGNEAKAIEELVDHLMFRGQDQGGEVGIYRAPDIFLNKEYMPGKQDHQLSKPSVDTIIGYVPTQHFDAQVPTPLNEAEEDVVSTMVVLFATFASTN